MNTANEIQFKRLKHDVNGNPRFVCHWTNFNADTYSEAIAKSKELGGRKYNNKQYGGGIVFQEYEGRLTELSNKIQFI